MGANRKIAGFTLPTVLITSIIMLTLLLVGLQFASSYAAALRERYYNQLAREAAESGLGYALTCLRGNGMISTWKSKTLKPETDCQGDAVPGQTADVLKKDNLRTRFVVAPLAAVGKAEVQQAYATGYVDMLRPNGTVWKTYSRVLSIATGAQTRIDSLAFGYSAPSPFKVFFTTIDSAGKVRSVGANDHGQLGAGFSSASQSSPVVYNIPQRASVVYANFVSVGSNIMARDEDGNIWGAGKNDNGILGNGNHNHQVTPVRFGLPHGVKAVSLSNGWANYVLGDDHNIYAAGWCNYGMLGTGDYDGNPYNCAARLANSATPKRVALPTPNIHNPATIPTSTMVQDRYNGYVVMRNGAVYGWGANDYFQLGQPTMRGSMPYIGTSRPIKIGRFGDPGQPRAVQLAFNGGTIYILGDNGKVYATGSSDFGQLGFKRMALKLPSTLGGHYCLAADGRGSSVKMKPCDGSSQQMFDLDLTNRRITSGGLCLENHYPATTVTMARCDGSQQQRWAIDPASTSLIMRRAGTSAYLQADASLSHAIVGPGGGNPRAFFAVQTPEIVQLDIPGFVEQISSDEMFASYRNSAGEVYSTGFNGFGAMGTAVGARDKLILNDKPVKFALPAGVKAVDIWSTAWGARVTNLFVVGDDGKVYGSGSNGYGQLGIGNTIDQTTATAMQGFGHSLTDPRAKHVQSGGGTTVIFTTDNRVYTVGNNNGGQLGDGTTTNSSTPILGKYTNVPIAEFLVF